MKDRVRTVVLMLFCFFSVISIVVNGQTNPSLWESWERVADLPFSPRDGVGVVKFKNEHWMLGGWVYGPVTSDIYKSADGIHWNFVGKGEWPGRHGAGMIAFNNKLWVISGDGHPDVWSSIDGKNWIQEVEVAPWGKRYAPYVTVFNDKIWLMGGVSFWDESGNYNQEFERAFNDVWSSVDGVNWTLEVSEAPWGPRGLIHGSLIHNNQIWIIGGGSKYWNWPTQIYNDVWKSKNGIDWELVSENNPWVPRIHFTTISFDDKIWIMDGTTQTHYLNNDVWYSVDGVEWFCQNGVTKFPAVHASTVFSHDNALYMTAGLGLDAIYRYKPPIEQTISFLPADEINLVTTDIHHLNVALSSALEPHYFVEDTTIADVVQNNIVKAKSIGKTRVGITHPGTYGFFPLDTQYVNLHVKMSQIIVAEVLPEATINDTIKLNLQVIQGLPVTLLASDQYQVIDKEAIVPLVTGNIQIGLAQEGNDIYKAWSYSLESFVHNTKDQIQKQQQFLTGNPTTASILTYVGNPDFDLNLFTTAGLPLSIVSMDGNIAEVTDKKVKIHKAGTTFLCISNAGDANYFPLYTSLIQLVVQKKEQFLEDTIQSISVEYNPKPVGLTLTSNAGLPLIITVSDTAIAELLSDGDLSLKKAGNTYITVTNAGNEEYLALETKRIALKVLKKHQNVSGNIPSEAMLSDTIIMRFTSDSGLGIRLMPNKDIIVLSDTTFVPLRLGELVVDVVQEGDENHMPWYRTHKIFVGSSDHFLVYPNPASSQVNIFAGGRDSLIEHIKVLSTTGKIIKRFSVTAADRVYQLNIEALAPGVYLIIAEQSSGRNIYAKLVKNH